MTDRNANIEPDAAHSSAIECPLCHEHKARFSFAKASYDIDATYDIYKCAHCDFMFVHPYPSNQVLTDFYQYVYRGATKTFYPKAGDRRWRGFWRSLQFFAYLRNKDVLDIGCGGGFMVEAFARLGARASGLDISENSIAYARHRWPQFQFYCETQDVFRQRKLTYDFVFTSEVLEHVPGPDEFMRTLAAVTRKGGYVYVSTPATGHPATPTDFIAWRDICPPEHVQWFNYKNLVDIFARYGFQVHKIYKNKTPAHSLIFKKI